MILYIDIIIVSSINAFIIYRVTHFVNGIQFLNPILVFKSPPVAIISPVTRIYASQ